jgi:hypothetical protein
VREKKVLRHQRQQVLTDVAAGFDDMQHFFFVIDKQA